MGCQRDQLSNGIIHLTISEGSCPTHYYIPPTIVVDNETFSFVGNGSYNAVYASPHSQDQVYCKIRLTELWRPKGKWEEDKCLTDSPQRSVRLCNLLNPPKYKARVCQATVQRCRYVSSNKRVTLSDPTTIEAWIMPRVLGKSPAPKKVQAYQIEKRKAARIITDITGVEQRSDTKEFQFTNVIEDGKGDLVCIDPGMALLLEKRIKKCRSKISLDFWLGDKTANGRADNKGCLGYADYYSTLLKNPLARPIVCLNMALIELERIRPYYHDVSALQTNAWLMRALANNCFIASVNEFNEATYSLRDQNDLTVPTGLDAIFPSITQIKEKMPTLFALTNPATGKLLTDDEIAYLYQNKATEQNYAAILEQFKKECRIETDSECEYVTDDDEEDEPNLTTILAECPSSSEDDTEEEEVKVSCEFNTATNEFIINRGKERRTTIPNPINDRDDPPYLHDKLLSLLNSEIQKKRDVHAASIEAAVLAYRKDMKKYSAAAGEENALRLLTKMYYAILASDNALQDTPNLKKQKAAIKAKLNYRIALYDARIAGNDKTGFAKGGFFKNYSALAKLAAAQSLLCVIKNNRELETTDLNTMTGAANSGELGVIFDRVKALKAANFDLKCDRHLN